MPQPPSEDAFRANGGGSEFAIATWESEQWPCTILEMIASYAIRAPRPVAPRDRLPAGDLMEEQPGGALLAMASPGYNLRIETGTGTLSIIHLAGITSSEFTRAKTMPGPAGSEVLEKALLAYEDVGCVTHRARTSITTRADFEGIWADCGGS